MLGGMNSFEPKESPARTPGAHRRKTASGGPVIVAVADPTLHPEALHAVAATGREVVDTLDPREIIKLAHRASALLIDSVTAEHAATVRGRPRTIFLAASAEQADYKLALRAGAEDVFVLPGQAPELLSALGREDRAKEGAGKTLALMGAAGGVGCSVLAAAVAARQGSAVIVDAQPQSGGIDLLLGIEDAPGLRWSDLPSDTSRVLAHDLLEGLPATPEGVRVLTSARNSDNGVNAQAVADVLACLGSSAFVVVDSPTHGEIFEAVAGACDGAVLVVPAEVRATASAFSLGETLRKQRVATAAVLRHRSWSGMDLEDVEELSKLDVLAECANIRGLSKTIELSGMPATLPRPLGTAAGAVLAWLEELS